AGARLAVAVDNVGAADRLVPGRRAGQQVVVAVGGVHEAGGGGGDQPAGQAVEGAGPRAGVGVLGVVGEERAGQVDRRPGQHLQGRHAGGGVVGEDAEG